MAAVSLVSLKGCIDWSHVDCSARVLSYLSSVTSYLRQELIYVASDERLAVGREVVGQLSWLSCWLRLTRFVSCWQLEVDAAVSRFLVD